MIIPRIITIFFITIAAVISVASAAEFETDFEGTWRGEFQKIDPHLQSSVLPDLTTAPELFYFAIEISGDNTRVFMMLDDEWQEVKPGSFGSVTHKTNAVVAALDSFFSGDGKSGWVETWNFTLTTKDEDSLYAYWVRAVSNPHLSDGSSPDARFFISRFGTLRRSEPVRGVNSMQIMATTPYSKCQQANLVCGLIGRQPDDALKTNQKIDQRD